RCVSLLFQTTSPGCHQPTGLAVVLCHAVSPATPAAASALAIRRSASSVPYQRLAKTTVPGWGSAKPPDRNIDVYRGELAQRSAQRFANGPAAAPNRMDQGCE